MKNKIVFVFLCFFQAVYSQPEDSWEIENEEVDWTSPIGFILAVFILLIFLDFRNDMKNDKKKPRT
jgi:hypothetical protein